MSGRPWTARELSVLRSRYPHEPTAQLARDIGRSVSATYNMVDRLGLRKTDEYLASPAACRLRRDDSVGREYRFRKGNVPFNKGKHYKPTGSEKGWFKPGTLNGAARLKELPVGSERVQGGVLLRKVSEGQSRWMRWQPVHRMAWESVHGPVPAGHIVVFKTGRHTTISTEITLDRLECITRVENMRRNSRHARYGPELNRLMQLRGALKRKILNHEARKQA